MHGARGEGGGQQTLDRRESRQRLCRGKKNGKMRNCTSEHSLKKKQHRAVRMDFICAAAEEPKESKGKEERKKNTKEKGVEKEKHKGIRVPASAGVNV